MCHTVMWLVSKANKKSVPACATGAGAGTCAGAGVIVLVMVLFLVLVLVLVLVLALVLVLVLALGSTLSSHCVSALVLMAVLWGQVEGV